MSLPARQLQKLREIEGRLDSDPRLKSLFGIFSRLTRGEAMPWFEDVPVRPVADLLAATRGLFRRIARWRASRVRVLLLLPAALSAIVCTVMIAAGFPGPPRSAPTAKPPAARELIVKTSRICRLGLVRFPVFAC